MANEKPNELPFNVDFKNDGNGNFTVKITGNKDRFSIGDCIMIMGEYLAGKRKTNDEGS